MTGRPAKLSANCANKGDCDDDTSRLTATAVLVYNSPQKIPTEQQAAAGIIKTGSTDPTAIIWKQSRVSISRHNRNTAIPIVSVCKIKEWYRNG